MPPPNSATTRGRGLTHLVFAIARASFMQASRYRTGVMASLAANSLFGLVRASLLSTAIIAAGGSLNGYTVTAAVTYSWLTQSLIGPLHVFSWVTLSQRIYDGAIATDLGRPINPLLWYWGEFMGAAAMQFLSRSIPMLLIGALLTGLSLPGNLAYYALGLLVLFFACTLQYFLYFMVNCWAFFTVQIRGVMQTYMLIAQVFAGFMVPLTWFPAWFQSIAAYTPFPYTVQLCIDTFSGRLSLEEVFSGLLRQATWVAATLFVALLVVDKLRRRVEVQGG